MIKKLMDVIDRPVFFIGTVICFFFILWTVIAEDSVNNVFSSLQSFFAVDFGWLYLLLVSFIIVFLLYLALGKYGKIRLGNDDEKPQYSTKSWFAMLFAAGMGIGLVFWGVAEPLTHYLTPPVGAGRTAEAASDAMRITFTHWGIHPWAVYGIFGLPLAYFQFRKNKPALLSSCLEPLFGNRRLGKGIGVSVDVIAVVATIFGVATSLGLGAMQINSGLNYVFGIPYSNSVIFVIITVATVLFIASSVSGIERGIKTISDINMVLMFVLLAFVLFAGATLFIADFYTESLGNYLSSLIKTSFWTDTFGESGTWLSGWTVFYWAWWLSWGPFVGGFIARISRGRTIREFVIGTMLVPTVFCSFFMCVMGGNAIHFDMQGVTGIADALQENTSYALFAMLNQFPCAKLVSVLFIVLITIFFVSSADSSTFVCSSMTAKGIPDPPGILKIVWGIFEGAVAILLLYVGGLSALQTVCIVIGFPLLLLCIGFGGALLKSLKEE